MFRWMTFQGCVCVREKETEREREREMQIGNIIVYSWSYTTLPI